MTSFLAARGRSNLCGLPETRSALVDSQVLPRCFGDAQPVNGSPAASRRGAIVKIALVSERASPLAVPGGKPAGGQSVCVAALAGGLARRGHDVTVYTRRDAPGPPPTVHRDGYVIAHVP